MLPVEEYKTLCAPDVETLDKMVNEAIRQGFELYGNPYALAEGHGRCQALIKREEPQQSPPGFMSGRS